MSTLGTTIDAHTIDSQRAGQMPAGFLIRLIAWLIDACAIGAVVTLLTLGHPLPLVEQGLGEAANPTHALDTLVSFVYFTLFWSDLLGGATIGMRLLGLRVVGANGLPIGYGTAVARFVGLILSILPLFVGVLWIAVDAMGQGWHDKLARTWIVRAGQGASSVESIQAVQPAGSRARGSTTAMVFGALGGLCGAVAAALALRGDAALAAATLGWPAALALAGLIAAVVAFVRADLGAVLLAGAVVGYLLVLGPAWADWWAGLGAATAAGPSFEQRYWETAPALAVFAISAFFLAGAAAAAAFAALGRPAADRYTP